MHILTIHFIFSVLSKCCFPSWVEKVFIKIYQESERKPINYLFAVQNGKISSLLYFIFCCSIPVALYLKIFILVQSVWVYWAESDAFLIWNKTFFTFYPPWTAFQYLSLCKRNESFFIYLLQLVNLKFCKHIPTGESHNFQDALPT